MLRMKIETLYRGIDGQWAELRPPFCTERHGWKSADEYVHECSKRFKHNNPKPYGNGLEMRGAAGTLQRITFETC